LLTNAPSAEEKQIAIFAPQVSYTLPVVQRSGQDYVGLLEALEPLGAVSAKTEGRKWKLRFRDREAEFHEGKHEGRVRGRKVELGSRLLLENNRGLLPLRALPALIGRFLDLPVEFHEPGRRLFVGDAGTHFTAELHENALALNFSAPVNPTVSTEPGKLQMVFIRDPMRAAVQTLHFNSPLVSAVSLTEDNGRAALTVYGPVPLLATFANGGRTINLVAAPSQAAQAPPPQPPAQAAGTPPAGASAQAPPAPVVPALPGKPPFMVMVDASHGGEESGAVLADKLLEKDVTLGLARRLRLELLNRGIVTAMSRDSDLTLTAEQRAAMANSSRVAVFITVHAASQGTGVRLYTSLLPPAETPPGPFLPWDTAQSAFLGASRVVTDAIKSELDKREVPARELMAAVRPLNNIAAVAIAVEVAPASADLGSLTANNYQQAIASAVAEAVAATRGRVEAAL